MSVTSIRDQFPSLASQAYFNFGGQGPLPQVSLDAIASAYEKLQQQGPFSGQINAWLDDVAGRTRAAIAAELGTTADTIALTENVTAGCNIALWGWEWQAGDRVLLTDCEHPGIVATVEEIARRFQVEVVTCSLLDPVGGADPVAAIAAHLTPNTRAVVLSHLLWNTGEVLPLRAIADLCRDVEGDRPIRLVVDAAQSAGSLPLNLPALGVDFYAFTGHKWFCGPAGVGAVYVRPDAQIDHHPTFIGWRSVQIGAGGKPTGWKSDARRYEVATSAYPEYLGLERAIALHRDWGSAQERYQQICQLSRDLWQRLNTLDGVQCCQASPPPSGLVCFQLTNGLPHLPFVQALEASGFLLRTLARPDCIRACVHYFTLPLEIEALVEAIARIIEEQKRAL